MNDIERYDFWFRENQVKNKNKSIIDKEIKRKIKSESIKDFEKKKVELK